jgi:hypothetical protein
VADPSTGSGDRPLDALKLPEIDKELAAVWPRPRRTRGGTSPDVQRIAMLMATGVYESLKVDADDHVVDPDGEAIIEAARVLGWTHVRVQVEPSVSDPIVLLASKLRREHYPTSRILAIVTSPVFWSRYQPIVQAAKARMLDGKRAKALGRSRDLIAEALGMPGQGRSLQTIVRARRLLGDEPLDAIARGDSSMTIDGIQREVRAQQLAPQREASVSRAPVQEGRDAPWRQIFSDNWQCRTNSGRFGLADFRGSAPDEVIAHLIERYTQEGDLVVDPMAGSGRTIDIAKYLKRRVVAADQEPRRDDIIEHRIETSLIPQLGKRRAKLVILDPPYFTVMGDHYGAGSASHLPWEKFLGWLRAVARSAHEMTAPGGHAGTLVMNVRVAGEGPKMLRRELESAMERAGWTLVDEFVAFTTLGAFAGQIHRAQQDRMLLPKSLYVQAWRRGT